MDMVTCLLDPRSLVCILQQAALDLELGGMRDHICGRRRREWLTSANLRQWTISLASLETARLRLLRLHRNRSCQPASSKNLKTISSTLLNLHRGFVSGIAVSTFRLRKLVFQLVRQSMLSPSKSPSIPYLQSKISKEPSRFSPENTDLPSAPCHTQQRRRPQHTHQPLFSPLPIPAFSHKPGSLKWPTRSLVAHKISITRLQQRDSGHNLSSRKMSGRILRHQLIKLLCKSYNYLFYSPFLCSKVGWVGAWRSGEGQLEKKTPLCVVTVLFCCGLACFRPHTSPIIIW